jgi:hypothetical protein
VSHVQTPPPPPALTLPRGRRSRAMGALLWVAAVAVMLGSATYQRATGPTYPLRGEALVAGEPVKYALIRSETTTRDARVEVADPGAEATGTLVYRRYPTGDGFQRVPMTRDGGALVAHLPRQPAAGKVEYHLELETAAGPVRIPASPDRDPILRYKDPVPVAALLPHILLMFFAILVGVRAGLAALAGREETRRLAWTSLALLTVGGMILGPIVQNHAFGAYWTGFPFGADLTDNKTLIMWVAWIGACAVLGLRAPSGSRRGAAGRASVVAAAAVMLAVYLIPHSMRGSELDYGQVDQGVDPTEAVRTGR